MNTLFWRALAAAAILIIFAAGAALAEKPAAGPVSDKDYNFAGITWQDDAATVMTKMEKTGLFPQKFCTRERCEVALTIPCLGGEAGKLVQAAMGAAKVMAVRCHAAKPGLIRKVEAGFSPDKSGTGPGDLMFTRVSLIDVSRKFPSALDNPVFQGLNEKYGPPTTSETQGKSISAFLWVKGKQMISFCLVDQTIMYLNLEVFEAHGSKVAMLTGWQER